MDTETKEIENTGDITATDENGGRIETYRNKTRMSGCEMTDGQILFLIAELDKIFTINSFLTENGLEFANERTRQSIETDFEKLIFAPENKGVSFKELLNSLVTDENGEFLWDLFTPESGRKHRLTVDGIDGTGAGNILPPCGNTDNAEKNNPFDKNTWNMSEQSRIYKENPEIAKYLAAAAKQKLFI